MKNRFAACVRACYFERAPPPLLCILIKKKLVENWVVSVVGQRQSSMMPFTLEELILLSRCLRDACLGIIKLAYPETKPEVREEYVTAFQSIGVTTNSEMQQCIQMEQKRWVQLFKVCDMWENASCTDLCLLGSFQKNRNVEVDFRHNFLFNLVLYFNKLN